MKKIAFLDVDQTLIDNQTSQYNEALIHFLKNNRFDAIYLVTGRNPNDLWQHVLRNGKNYSLHWRNQLLFRLIDYLQSRGVKVSAVSTPFDHYLNQIASDNLIKIRRLLKITDALEAGAFFTHVFKAYEESIAQIEDARITAQLLSRSFSSCTGGPIYDNGMGGKEELALSLPTFLAMMGDVDKKGQIEFLLRKVEAETAGPLEVYFFDDKPENLKTAESIFASRPHHRFQGIEVKSVHDFMIPTDLAASSRDSFFEPSSAVDTIGSHASTPAPGSHQNTMPNYIQSTQGGITISTQIGIPAALQVHASTSIQYLRALIYTSVNTQTSAPSESHCGTQTTQDGINIVTRSTRATAQIRTATSTQTYPSSDKIIKNLLKCCELYREHFAWEVRLAMHRFSNQPPNEMESLTIKKCYQIERLINILKNEDLSSNEKLNKFKIHYPEAKQIISIRNDNYGILFLKTVTTILSLGTAYFFGLWNVRGKQTGLEIDEILQKTPR